MIIDKNQQSVQNLTDSELCFKFLFIVCPLWLIASILMIHCILICPDLAKHLCDNNYIKQTPLTKIHRYLQNGSFRLIQRLIPTLMQYIDINIATFTVATDGFSL